MDEQIRDAMRDFCLRVLSGKGTPQETATLPSVLAELRRIKSSTSGN